MGFPNGRAAFATIGQRPRRCKGRPLAQRSSRSHQCNDPSSHEEQLRECAQTVSGGQANRVQPRWHPQAIRRGLVAHPELPVSRATETACWACARLGSVRCRLLNRRASSSSERSSSIGAYRSCGVTEWVGRVVRPRRSRGSKPTLRIAAGGPSEALAMPAGHAVTRRVSCRRAIQRVGPLSLPLGASIADGAPRSAERRWVRHPTRECPRERDECPEERNPRKVVDVA